MVGMKKLLSTLLVAFSVVVFCVACGFAQQVRVFPPPPPLQSPIAGAIDFHVHSAPDVFGRNLNDIEVARLAAAQGMRALVFKNHITSTADRAAMVKQAVPEIEAFGGITLNQAVGGINPTAVEWMYRMSGGRGKVVWLPTFDADHHLKTFNEPGEGIKVAKDGKVTPEMEAVLKIIARENLVLHTGHVSPEEVLLVIKRARELGVQNIAVTHAMADVPGLSLEQMKQAAAMGAYLEYVYLNHLMGPHAHLGWMRHWKQVSLGDLAKAVKVVGAAHFILSTDLGQSGNPTHPDGYAKMVIGLKGEGVSQADLDLMMKKNPAKLLGLDD
jgi:microsomal dipeptidase-like Zn-dependent dipeptidase